MLAQVTVLDEFASSFPIREVFPSPGFEDEQCLFGKDADAVECASEGLDERIVGFVKQNAGEA